MSDSASLHMDANITILSTGERVRHISSKRYHIEEPMPTIVRAQMLTSVRTRTRDAMQPNAGSSQMQVPVSNSMLSPAMSKHYIGSSAVRAKWQKLARAPYGVISRVSHG